jgi:hypothetical protein
VTACPKGLCDGSGTRAPHPATLGADAGVDDPCPCRDAVSPPVYVDSLEASPGSKAHLPSRDAVLPPHRGGLLARSDRVSPRCRGQVRHEATVVSGIAARVVAALRSRREPASSRHCGGCHRRDETRRRAAQDGSALGQGVNVTAPRCDVAPWLLPREREPDDDGEERGMCDDTIDDGDSGDDGGDYYARRDW